MLTHVEKCFNAISKTGDENSKYWAKILYEDLIQKTFLAEDLCWQLFCN